ncbi:Vacuolar protein sorting-associated protein [Wickerhamomyces ciferrii]|uniref:Vacuolar protein sorting-associated protein n=1 Tax=Wickerhamomyces ciferrii (strain ATCC 14091 / BCRC 22168 / CBS 111 / JCM 3599 / NBRC 0793 / NRRL Y-1031 F-60-10) TaxID=1206466 RepID=K0KX05_WICCF|nr:Vacuolar protein sorting-associated protein [Wickerhamomyces ciferrii]CCH46024.1 Vacuolar protein sorting-associated protein [Wickerhamomyces ciferrii]
MSAPGSPSTTQKGFSEAISTPSAASSVSESHISYKKPVKIKNELNEKRRNALKEYYKLKKQEKEQKNVQQENKPVRDEDSDGEEITAEAPVDDIDFLNVDFKDLVKDTNKLTSSINLINSSIKNIIYNNYYELIKLNDFLKDLNELDLSKLIVEDQNKENQHSDALNLLNDSIQDPTAASVKSLNFDSYEGDGFVKLKSLMNEIESLDNYSIQRQKPNKTNDGVATSITSMLNFTNENLPNEQVRGDIRRKIDGLVTKVKDDKNKEPLLRQLEEMQVKLK